jgi:hypothetical protein
MVMFPGVVAGVGVIGAAALCVVQFQTSNASVRGVLVASLALSQINYQVAGTTSTFGQLMLTLLLAVVFPLSMANPAPPPYASQYTLFFQILPVYAVASAWMVLLWYEAGLAALIVTGGLAAWTIAARPWDFTPTANATTVRVDKPTTTGGWAL